MTYDRRAVHKTASYKATKRNLDRFLRAGKFTQAYAKFTHCSENIIRMMLNRLHSYLLRRIDDEGVENVCSCIKAAEREYLLGRGLPFIKRKIFFHKKLPEIISRTLLSIHKVFVGKLDYSLDTIQWERTDLQPFFIKYEKSLSKVKSYLVGQGAKAKKSFERMITSSNWYKMNKDKIDLEKEAIRNLTADPTVDCNDRTGGEQFPLRITLSGCANGPALTSQSIDAKLLCLDENRDLRIALETISKLWRYNFKLDDYIAGREISLPVSASLGRLKAIHDKSCKTRIIAILDSYTQIALRPIHRLLHQVLTYLPRDFTENHQGGVDFLISNDAYCYSFDIKSATDTLPAEFGFAAADWVLSAFINQYFTEDDHRQVVKSIRTLMTERMFLIDSYVKDGKTFQKKVIYSTGQPMGTYASFPMLGLTQHMLVQLATVEVYGKIRPYLKYAVVGDDLVIQDDRVAEVYLRLCSELKIPINKSKTIQGQNTFEFCKRIVVDGHIRSVPSLKAHYVSLMTKEPYVLFKTYTEYRTTLPSFSTLCSVFKRGDLRDMLAFHPQVIMEGKPTTIEPIPGPVKAHAERCLFVQQALAKNKEEVKTQDPYLKRLNYGNEILSIFKSRLKKLCKICNEWKAIHQVTANTFYLSYVSTYLNRKKLRRASRSLFLPRKELSRSRRLRHLCMCNRNQWNLCISPK